MTIPAELRYTAEHEWIARQTQDGIVRVGITHFAQDSLGDVVFIDLPSAGTEVTAGDVVGEVESTKSVSDVYAPVTGKISAVNEGLVGAPERINSDPYGEGWMFDIELADADAYEALLDADSYAKLTE